MVQIKKDVLLSNYSNYKIGGPARLFAEVGSVEELKDALRLAKSPAQDDKIFILGGGTNILIDDKGFDGLVIHNKIGGILRLRSGQVDNVEAGSGVMVKDLLDFCIKNSLSGLEWAGGLPGTIGGSVRGNAGAFGGETKDSVSEVRSLNIITESNSAVAFEEKRRTNRECNFGYRNSIFKTGEGKDEFVTSVTISLKTGNKEEIRKAIQEKIDYRNNKHPMDYPNIGSIFKNVPFESLTPRLEEEFRQYVKNDPFPVMPTAKIIFLAGLKGKRISGAMVSDKHTNFIINVDNATAADVKQLIALEKKTVKDKFGILLEEEIIYLGS